MTDWVTEHDGSRWLSEEAAKEMIEALKPFAEYHRILMSMGGMAPKAGTIWATTSKLGTAEITVKDLKKVRAVLERIGEGA